MNVTEKAIKYGPWSVSKIEVAKTCQLRFKYAFVEKRPKKEPEDPRGRVGTAVHKFLELLLNGSAEDFAFRKAVIDAKLTTPEIEDLITFKENVFAFLKKVESYSEKNNVRNTLVESKFGLSKTLRPAKFFDNKNVFFRGVWDLCFILGKPVVTIIDHKTGKPYTQPDGKIAPQKPEQLKAYAVAAHRLFPSIEGEALRGIKSGINYVGSGEVIWEPMIYREQIIEEYEPWLIEYVNEAAENLDLDNAKPKEGNSCTFCEHRYLCPLISPNK